VTPPLLFVDDLSGVNAGMTVALPADESRHAAAALRMKTGELVLVADGKGRRAVGAAQVQGNQVGVVVASLEVIAQPNPRITIVQALAKGEHGELAVDLMTQVGVDRIIPWSASRSIVQWKNDRADKSRTKWINMARTAAKQSRRAWIPEISEVMSTKELVAHIPNFDATFILHEDAVHPLASAKLPASGEICLIVGPEGGISEAEIAEFLDAGAVTAALGSSVLRASLAGAIGLGVLSTRLRWADPATPNVGG